MLFALKEIFDAAKSSAFTVGCLRTLFYIKMQKVAKSRKLECTLDVLCHLYQTQMLLVASVFAALLLFIIYIFYIYFLYFFIFQFNLFVFIKLYLFYLNAYLSLHYVPTNLKHSA